MFPLRVHSYYSLMRGTSSPERLCRLAKKLGYPGLALTDRDNLYGLWPFLAACRRLGLKPVVGAELSEPESDRLATVLVCNVRGYVNLCRLLTRRHTEKHFELLPEVQRLSEGLFCLCSDLALLNQWHRAGIRVAADLGPQPTGHGTRLRTWAREAGVQAVVTPDSYLTNEDDYEIHRLLRVIKSNTTLSGVAQEKVSAELRVLREADVYRRSFEMWPEVVDRSDEIAGLCQFHGPEFGVVMPPWDGDDAMNVLRQSTYHGACRRYGEDLSETVVERIEHELSIIESMGFSSYFLVVRDIVRRSRKNTDRGTRRTCGRGSGAASLVAYCLEITNVCPVKHNLYFERFLNHERSDPPDIDIDFAWDERDQVLAEVFCKYGDQVAMVSNHICFKPRMAIRETAKAFGLPASEISAITERLPWLYTRDGKRLQECLRELPSLRDQDFGEPWPEILRMADKLIGIPRYLSVHPGGVVITPGPITDYVPVEMASKGVRIIQWEKDAAEEAGLIKIDLLGNRSLGVIRDCIASVRRNGQPFDESSWQPEDDAETKASVANGMTMGCFYIESPAMRLLQKKAVSGEFEQLVLQSSIIRPAANEFVREYVRRLHGGYYQPLHEKVSDVLDETFGLMVYQEDVSRVAVALAGFSHGRADGLRKVLSKKDRNLRLKDYRKEFYRGCEKNGLTMEQIDEIWAMMMSFDGYSFCKPHSASYAMVSYQAAYLKKHFPAEFMAAVLSNRGGFYSTFAYVSEAKRLGLKILPPDVNSSGIDWIGEKKMIRVGLQAVRGLSRDLIERVVEHRNHKNYTGVYDFFQRAQPEENEARALIHAGALDSLDGRGRAELFYYLASFRKAVNSRKNCSLFPVNWPAPPLLPRQGHRERLRNEYKVLGFLCEYHPIQFYNRQAGTCSIKACRLHDYKGRRVSFIGWLLTGKLVSTRTGRTMEFLTFEDETGMVETTFFPETYERYAYILGSGRPYRLTGRVEEDYEAVTLTVDGVNLLR